MSPKIWVGNIGLTMYHSGSVPLNVGLHKEHPFCPVPGFREVHTQIVGIGKMQQCYEKDLATLYFEETMAPGHTHKPMFDEEGNEIMDETVVPEIPPLEPTVEQPVYDDEGNQTGTGVVDNPLIVADDAERDQAQLVIDNTPEEVQDFEV